MINKTKSLIFQEEGQGMTEYGLVLGIIAFGVVAILIAMRGKIVNLFNGVNGELDQALTPAP